MSVAKIKPNSDVTCQTAENIILQAFFPCWKGQSRVRKPPSHPVQAESGNLHLTCQVSNELEDEIIAGHPAIYDQLVELVVGLGKEGVHQLLLAEGDWLYSEKGQASPPFII